MFLSVFLCVFIRFPGHSLNKMLVMNLYFKNVLHLLFITEFGRQTGEYIKSEFWAIWIPLHREVNARGINTCKDLHLVVEKNMVSSENKISVTSSSTSPQH